MNGKTKRNLLVICLIIILSCLSIFTYINFVTGDLNAYADEVQSLSNNNINMNEDYFYYNGKKLALTSYDSVIGSTQDFISDDNGRILVVSSDDAITSIIPKEKFTNVGSSLVIGKEWGYYINTINDYNDIYGEPTHISKNRRSYVTIFDLSYSFNSSNGEIIVGVSPLFQYEYVTLSPEEDIMVCYQDEGFSQSSYTGRMRYRLVNTNEPLVVSSSTSPRKRYYLKDISYSMTLYNEQSPNQLNGGEIYNAQRDNGSYFTYMDYMYDGIVRDENDFPADSVATLAKSAFSFLTGAVKRVPIIGTAFSTIKTIISLGDNILASSDVIDYYQNSVSYNTVEKHITSQNFNANRDEQIRSYGGLLKNMGIIVNTTIDGEGIWYGEGNSASAIFKITDSAINGMPHEYTRLVREVGVKIVDVETDDVVEIESNADYFHLYSPVYDDINLESKNNIYVLPLGTNYYSFTPAYSGYYNIDISNSDLTYKISYLSEDIVSQNNTYFLDKNKSYNIKIMAKERGVIDTFSLSIDSGHLADNVEANECRILKVSVNDNDIYTLSTGNNNITIENIFIVESNNLNQYSAFKDGKYSSQPSIMIPLSAGDYYVVIENNSSNKMQFVFSIANCELGDLGSDNLVQFNGNNFTYIKLENLEFGDYTISLKNTSNVEYRVYDSNLNGLTTSLFGNGFCAVTATDSTIYIGVRTDSIEADNLIVNKNINAYSWEIYEDTNEEDSILINDKAVELERGRSYIVKLFINGKDVGANFNSVNPKSEFSYTLIDGVLSIEDYCSVSGRSFIIQYLYDSDPGGNTILFITPVYTITFEGIKSVVNSQSLIFNWEQTSDLYEFTYILKMGNETSDDFTISTYGKKAGTIYSEDITSKLDSFTSKVGYVEIKIYKIKIKTSQTIEEYLFDSSISVDGAFGGGSGTEDDPYLISCSRHFYNLEYNTDNSVHFKIEKSLIIYEPVKDFHGILGSKNYNQAQVEIRYNNHYNGLDNDYYIGMFVENHGTITNLQAVVNVTITGGANSMGAWVSSIAVRNYGTIENCRVTKFNVDSHCTQTLIGGIVAENYGKIENCYSYNNVISSGYFGGIAAKNFKDGSIKNCTVFGTVDVYIEHVENKYWTTYSGGIVANNLGSVSGCKIGGYDDETLFINVYVDYVDTLDLSPYLGVIYGLNSDSGSVSSCENISFVLDTGNLHSWWAWFVTYDQKEHINYDIG